MDISAANSFTPAKKVQSFTGFDVSVLGTWAGTITAQLSKDGSTGWIDVETLTANGIKTGEAATDWFIRAGFKTGEYTSGTATVEVY